MTKPKEWHKIDFPKSSLIKNFNPFDFSFFNVFNNKKEFQDFKKIDDFNKAVILLSIQVMLSDGFVSKEEQIGLVNHIFKYYEEIPQKSIEIIVEKYKRHFFDLRNKKNKRIETTSIIKELNEWIKDKVVKNHLCYFLFEIAFADKRFTLSEKQTLLYISHGLGLTQQDISRLFAFFEGKVNNINFDKKYHWEISKEEHKARNERQRRNRNSHKQDRNQQQQRSTSVNHTQQTYLQAMHILGVTKNCTEQHVKRAYRKLVREYHPDRFINQSKIQVDKATERFITIQKAYELIKEIRRIK
jgi:uncharacterized tellurite resistance protein B-like protein